MAKKKRKEGGEGQQEGKGTKDLKIVSVAVVKPEQVVKNPRQMALLYVIARLGPTHEKTLQHILYDLQEEYGVDLGYEFRKVGNTPYSPQLKTDIVQLLYVGFIETEPGLYRKIRVTGQGKDVLDKHGAPPKLVETVNSNFEALRNKASMLDEQLDLEIRRRFQLQRPRRRFPI